MKQQPAPTITPVFDLDDDIKTYKLEKLPGMELEVCYDFANHWAIFNRAAAGKQLGDSLPLQYALEDALLLFRNFRSQMEVDDG